MSGKKETQETTVADVLESLQERPTLRAVLTLLLLLLNHSVFIFAVFYPNFGGRVPYTSWSCLSEKCETHTNQTHDRDTLCSGNLKEDEDFSWEMQGRGSFAVDWGIYCEREYLGTLLSSLYFVGGAVGLIIGSYTFDMYGRRITSCIGYAVVGICMLAGAAAPNMEVLMVVRVVLGLGGFMGLGGLYVYVLECTAIKWRALVSSLMGILWGLGELLLAPGMAYLIKDWRWLSVAWGLLILTVDLSWFLVPASPRQLFDNRGDEKAAKASLMRFSRIFGEELDLTNVRLVSSNEKKGKQANCLENLQDFVNVRELRIQVLLQMWQWMVIAFVHYGFAFSWSKLGKDIYWSYVYAGIMEILAANICWAGQEILGRRITIISFYLIAASSFLLALIPLDLGSASPVSFEQLLCLIGTMFVSGAWGTIYLYVNESAPTTHRGRISAICSLTARVGSFVGPQASLLFSWNKQFTLVIFAVLCISGGLVTIRLPETKGIQSPATAQEVEIRRRQMLDTKGEKRVLENILCLKDDK